MTKLYKNIFWVILDTEICLFIFRNNRKNVCLILKKTKIKTKFSKSLIYKNVSSNFYNLLNNFLKPKYRFVGRYLEKTFSHVHVLRTRMINTTTLKLILQLKLILFLT